MVNTVTEYLEATAARFPNKLAFSDDVISLTFSDLRTLSRRIGSLIGRRGYGKKPVAIFLDKTPYCIAAMMGVPYGGCFYTVIDVHMPQARIEKIMGVLEPAAVFTDREHEEAARAFAKDADVLLLEDTQAAEEDAVLLEEIHKGQTQEDIFYVLFTSGSTGIPKGVVTTHRAEIHYLEMIAAELPVNEDSIFCNQAPFYFVLSGFEIFSTIKNGATTFIPPQGHFMFPVVLLNYMKEHHVNSIYWVPSMLSLVANFRALPEVHLDDLKVVFFGGESMPAKQLNMWRREYPDVAFYNLYGPTELTDICTYYLVEGDIADNDSISIGIPGRNMKLVVLDDNNELVKPGGVGELCAAGPSLAEGYYKDPERTAAVFTPNPVDPSERIYHTGDLVQMTEEGELVFLGRKDFQIKHMGNRIELGEIEANVSALDGIDVVCCVFDQKRDRIICFYTGTMDEKDLNEALKASLPEYMIPNRYEHLEAMPFNLNGKIDRALLKTRI